jgi:hypothetical protein
MEYVHGILTVASQLQVIGVELGEEDVSDILIYSLVPKFSAVVTAPMQRAGSLTVEDISVRYSSLHSYSAQVCAQSCLTDFEYFCILAVVLARKFLVQL